MNKCFKKIIKDCVFKILILNLEIFQNFEQIFRENDEWLREFNEY